jgi:hypothetical protein
MAEAENSSERNRIQSSLQLILESAEGWLERLRKREQRVRLASSFLTVILVLAILAISSIFALALTGQIKNFGPPPPEVFPLIGVSGAVALGSGVAAYFILKRKHERELKELASIISRMKQESQASIGATEGALSLAERIVNMLPELVRKRSQDALLFGVASFFLSLLLFRFPPLAVLIGLIVWYYTRRETRKTYMSEIDRLEKQRIAFEQRKKDFTETL